MSRRHHHIGREPRTELLYLDPLGEALLDALEVEIRARRAYELVERAAVDELNANMIERGRSGPTVTPTPWADTDPETRRDYRRGVLARMHEAEQLVGDRAAKLPAGRYDGGGKL